MPVNFCYCLGYAIACISPSIIVPGTMSLNERGYGRKKGISSTMIAAGTFDDIICILIFGIVSTITFISVEGTHGTGKKSPGYKIGIIFVEIVVGGVIGVLLGLCGWFFKYIKHWKCQLHLKAIWCIAVAVADIVAVQKWQVVGKDRN